MMPRSDSQILIFARYPVPGQAKTRLIPVLGPVGAARLHRRLTEHVVGVARKVRTATGAAVTVWYTGGGKRDFRAWLGYDLDYAPQPRGDLGDRMGAAFRAACRNGAKAALGVGTDLPGLSPEILHQAFEGLLSNDMVLGPATDGGYYLIGMKRFHPEPFRNIDWGTETVYRRSRAVMDRLNLTVAPLPWLNDVDREADLALLEKDPGYADVFSGKPGISVIIPTLNEAEGLGRVLAGIGKGDAAETIVVDGGSRDATCDIARRAGARVEEIPGGRAAQQNAGAALAKGPLLLFLHGDTLLPDGFAPLIRRTLDHPSTVAGAFRFRTDLPGPGMRLVERAADFRSRVWQWPYGDQGLFMEKRVFDEMGGFAPLPIMEDFELVGRLRRRGALVTLPDPVVTSGRRWRQRGVFRTTLVNQVMIAGYFAGVPIGRLERFYRQSRKTITPGKENDHESELLRPRRP